MYRFRPIVGCSSKFILLVKGTILENKAFYSLLLFLRGDDPLKLVLVKDKHLGLLNYRYY